MSFGRLLFRNLWFHHKAHLAVLLGVAVGAAVLAGALLVGDSLRGSLRQRAETQRAGIDYALTAPRFFQPLPADKFPGTQIESVVLASGSIRHGEKVIRGATIIGGANELLRARPAASSDGAALAESLALELGARIGDTITLRHPKTSALPRESLLGRRDDKETTAEWEIAVSEILPDNSPAAQFQIFPGAAQPKNIYVPLRRIQQQAGAGAKVNAILARGGQRDALQEQLHRNLTLDDWGLILRNRESYLSIESSQSMLEPTIVDAVRDMAREQRLRLGETLVYLANRIGHDKQFIAYSVVAALDPALPAPLGPFLPMGVENLQDDEIILADWPESPLRDVSIGSKITLTYFEPELRDGKLVESQTSFRLRGRVQMTGVAADPYLTPTFPGVTDRLSLREWDPPFPYDNRLVQKRDEDYWKKYRTTPKAYVTLAAGQKLWGSRYGQLTTIRIAAEGSQSARLTGELLSRLPAEKGGFVFEDLRARNASASRGGQDFGGLFLGFSFFLIAAAMLLVGLLTRLNVERRASEVGLLMATGWTSRKVLSLFLLEGLAVAAVGAALGLAAAFLYAWLMIELLVRLWPDPHVGSFLGLHVGSTSLAAGWVGAVLMSAGMIFWALRGLRRVAPSALLAGVVQPAGQFANRKKPWLHWAVAGSGIVLGAVSLVAGVGLDNPMFRALSFFAGGSLLLTGFLAGLLHWLLRERHGLRAPHGLRAIAELGVRNAGRNPVRSLLTAGLLAAAAFLLVAVESFRRHPERDFENKSGGSGGFPLFVQTDLPIYGDLNGEGRQDILDALRIRYQQQADPTGKSVQERTRDAEETLKRASIFSLRVRAGDDASCLNLYQAGKPRLLGMPKSLRDRGGFRFVATAAKSSDERANPWLLLERELPEGVVPVIAEENTVTWMLKIGLGDEFTASDDQGRPVRLRVVAMLKDSVFQSEVLMSEEAFVRLYPREEGRKLHLVEAPPNQIDRVTTLLLQGLAKHGPTVGNSRDRVATFMAVENTYLTTFQLLGGFGLLLGVLGLAAALLRGTWERRGELALLRAVGYRRQALATLVLAENVLLLLCGLGIGVAAAAISVLPHVTAGGSMPFLRLSILLAVVLASGLAAGFWAVRAALAVPLLPALRRE